MEVWPAPEPTVAAAAAAATAAATTALAGQRHGQVVVLALVAMETNRLWRRLSGIPLVLVSQSDTPGFSPLEFQYSHSGRAGARVGMIQQSSA